MASTKRTVLDTLGRATLHKIADGEAITLTDRCALDVARDTLSRKRGLTPGACWALRDSGREMEAGLGPASAVSPHESAGEVRRGCL